MALKRKHFYLAALVVFAALITALWLLRVDRLRSEPVPAVSSVVDKPEAIVNPWRPTPSPSIQYDFNFIKRAPVKPEKQASTKATQASTKATQASTQATPEPLPTPIAPRGRRNAIAFSGDKLVHNGAVYVVPASIVIVIQEHAGPEQSPADRCQASSRTGRFVNMPCQVDWPQPDGTRQRWHYFPCKRQIANHDPGRAAVPFDYVDEPNCATVRLHFNQ